MIQPVKAIEVNKKYEPITGKVEAAIVDTKNVLHLNSGEELDWIDTLLLSFNENSVLVKLFFSQKNNKLYIILL